MPATRRCSAWDLAALARAGRGERAMLLRETRFRAIPGWSPFFGRRTACIFETRRSRALRLAGEWLAFLAVGAAILLVFLDLPRDPATPHPVSASSVGLALVNVGLLWWTWSRLDPRVVALRHRRTRLATTTLASCERGSAASGAIEALAEEILYRREAWKKGLSRPRVLAVAWLHPPAATLMVAGMLCMVVGGVMSGLSFVRAWPTSPCLIPVAMVACLASSGFIASRLLGRLSESVDGSLCPDCEYELNSVPGALPIAASAGVPIGPRRCPECGCPWPLIPPPTS